MNFFIFFIFFFSSRRRHTRSLRDWSSDVCSSDLHVRESLGFRELDQIGDLGADRHPAAAMTSISTRAFRGSPAAATVDRSEERRVGKECRSRWSPDHYKKKKENSSDK